MSNIIEYINVNKSFGDKQILKDVNLKIASNKIIGLLGKNGSGKSTLFKLANDLLTLTSGEIIIDGNPVSVESKKVVSYLPERSYLDPSLKVTEAIKFFETFYEDFDKAKAERLLIDLDLDPNMRLSKMSKGMREKVQLVLVMSRKAKIYILDEPLGGVDPASRDYILQTILTNFDKNATLLISTHMIADIEEILDEVVIIDNGQIVLHEDAKVLRKKEKCSIDEIFRRMFYVKQTTKK
ncbi:MAG: ABC transporter ATP-binding protein [Clostridiales bacterium]|nr:ABC transporter ATP-binding protein [Clostridiales bacterium]